MTITLGKSCWHNSLNKKVWIVRIRRDHPPRLYVVVDGSDIVDCAWDYELEDLK